MRVSAFSPSKEADFLGAHPPMRSMIAKPIRIASFDLMEVK
jgi:hypothetical protein